MDDVINDAYINLAAAIIIQAKNDYKRALRNEERREKGGVRALERFFRSDYGQFLSAGHGEDIIRMAREEVKKGQFANQCILRQ